MPRANSHTARLAPCQLYSVDGSCCSGDLSEEIRVVVVDDSVEKCRPWASYRKIAVSVISGTLAKALESGQSCFAFAAIF